MHGAPSILLCQGHKTFHDDKQFIRGSPHDATRSRSSLATIGLPTQVHPIPAQKDGVNWSGPEKSMKGSKRYTFSVTALIGLLFHPRTRCHPCQSHPPPAAWAATPTTSSPASATTSPASRSRSTSPRTSCIRILLASGTPASDFNSTATPPLTSSTPGSSSS